jgi:hypothetical protein
MAACESRCDSTSHSILSVQFVELFWCGGVPTWCRPGTVLARACFCRPCVRAVFYVRRAPSTPFRNARRRLRSEASCRRRELTPPHALAAAKYRPRCHNDARAAGDRAVQVHGLVRYLWYPEKQPQQAQEQCGQQRTSAAAGGGEGASSAMPAQLSKRKQRRARLASRSYRGKLRLRLLQLRRRWRRRRWRRLPQEMVGAAARGSAACG